jgi:very-short-patch-repair endonuclease
MSDLFRLKNLTPGSAMTAHVDLHQWWYSLKDIYNALENTSGHAQLVLLAKKYDCIQLKVPNKEWNQLDKKWEDCSGSEPQLMVSSNRLSELAEVIVNRTRKSGSHKSQLCKKLGVDIPVENIKVPIECSVLDIFIQTCPFKVETQYRLGKYKLDAFIPRLKIAIQIDENNHTGYSESEEKEYDTVIRDHQIVCIRFVPDPHHELESALQLVNLVWQRTLSPDFVDFKKNHMLA